MRKGTSALVWTAVVVAVCAATPLTAQETDATSGASWHIALEGMRDHDLQTYEVRKMMEEQDKEVSFSSVENGGATYRGVLLSDILAYIDEAAFEEPWQLDEAQWKDGYEVTLTASDGYAATFNTTEFAPDELVFAMMRDGESISPRVVGDAPRSLWVEDIERIEAGLETTDAEKRRASFELELLAGEDSFTFTLAELKQSAYFTRGRGMYTTSAGSEYAARYGGVIMKDFLAQFASLTEDTSVTFTATDGYEMTFSGDQILDESDGRWLLAFERDGESLPVDPGYIRAVKIGPDTPNVPGHLSVKMIKSIEIEGEPYAEFSLEMEGPNDITLDRSTLQSYMAFEKRRVTFTRKGESNSYTGIPLYKLLAFADDPDYIPHGQDFAIDAYDAEAATDGYEVSLVASDGFTVTLDSREVHENEDVIVALMKNGEPLPEREFPLILVWDENAETVPEGIRNVRNIEMIRLEM